MNADFFFLIFAALTLLCAALVVFNPFSRSPVTSAMFLVLTIISMSGLFVILHAFFLAMVQVIVYAGAVIVLFLFVIMLLNLQEEERRKIKKVVAVLSLVSVGSIAVMMLHLLHQAPKPSVTPSVEGSTINLGKLLFSQYVLPFEVISLVLLVAMIGAILLSKKELK